MISIKRPIAGKSQFVRHDLETMEDAASVMSTNSYNGLQKQPYSLAKITLVASIAAGVQFGWAIQLSLLTPFVQTLGITHTQVAFIWLCGPISGLVVPPVVGYYSDRCTHRLGRRKPFIISGAVLVCIAVFLVGFAADLGAASGDSLTGHSKPRALAVVIVGFWFLDVANNMLQGPCRAFLADISVGDHSRMRIANALFSFFMAVGNTLGYAASSYENLHKIFPSTLTKACHQNCANLKTCLIFSVCLLICLTVVALTCVSEKRHVLNKNEDYKHFVPFFGEIFTSLKSLKKPMWLLLLVTALNWFAWFPWILFATDWMGREIYGGSVEGSQKQRQLYDSGVYAGSLGLMMNSVVLGFASLAVEPLSRILGGAKKLWGILTIFLAICFILIARLSQKAKDSRNGELIPPPDEIKAYALAIFGVLGIPLAVTFSIPFALASIYCSTSGGGQGLSIGVLNLAIVIPQVIVSVISGCIDSTFGGGNVPAFIMGAIAATVSGLYAIFLLPKTPQQ